MSATRTLYGLNIYTAKARCACGISRYCVTVILNIKCYKAIIILFRDFTIYFGEIMKELTVAKNDANQRLDRFVGKAVPLLPDSLLQNIFA